MNCKKLVEDVFDELSKGANTLEKCKQEILKEFERVEDELDAELGNIQDLFLEH